MCLTLRLNHWFDPFTLLQLDIVIYSVNQYVSEGVWDSVIEMYYFCDSVFRDTCV